MITQITVENIKCGGCMNSIKTALIKLDDVQDITIDLETQTISIDSNIPLDRTKIVSRLSQMGYPEVGNNTVFLKAKSYVSCAIGNMSNKS